MTEGKELEIEKGTRREEELADGAGGTMYPPGSEPPLTGMHL